MLDLDAEESEEDDNPVYCAQPFNQPDIEALAEDPTLAAGKLDAEPIYPKKAGPEPSCAHSTCPRVAGPAAAAAPGCCVPRSLQ